MVLFKIIIKLIHGLLKLTGMTPRLVEIEPGTIIHIWLPTCTITKYADKLRKPAVVLIHGFGLNGVLTWIFQILALSKSYSVYVPDLLFFGDSITDKTDRSIEFQAECLAKALKKVGVETCSVVGFSCGSMIGFKMAELYPQLVNFVVASGFLKELSESVSKASLKRIGYSCWKDYLMPESVDGVKQLLQLASYSQILLWLPNFVYRDYLKVMFNNRKERAEILEALVRKDEEARSSRYPQKFCLLWGQEDNLMSVQLAQTMKEQCRDGAKLVSIKNAGHLVMLERPLLYSKHLKEILKLWALQD